jgi:hypothetical protein
VQKLVSQHQKKPVYSLARASSLHARTESIFSSLWRCDVVLYTDLYGVEHRQAIWQCGEFCRPRGSVTLVMVQTTVDVFAVIYRTSTATGEGRSLGGGLYSLNF